MTTEKAIEMCKSIKHYLTAGNPIWSKEEVAEAMTIAIEALQDTQNCVLTLFGDCSYDETGCGDCEIKQTIYKALSVDLVRCGECIYRGCCSELGDEIDANDYCSFGKREK